MLAFIEEAEVRTILVEKTDRLYRNFRDYVTIDDLNLGVHLVKENEVISRDSRSHQKFIHGIKVLMAKNYIDNLSEETKEGMAEKAAGGGFPTAPRSASSTTRTRRPSSSTASARRTFRDCSSGTPRASSASRTSTDSASRMA